jgi:hypothetical protein
MGQNLPPCPMWAAGGSRGQRDLVRRKGESNEVQEAGRIRRSSGGKGGHGVVSLCPLGYGGRCPPPPPVCVSCCWLSGHGAPTHEPVCGLRSTQLVYCTSSGESNAHHLPLPCYPASPIAPPPPAPAPAARCPALPPAPNPPLLFLCALERLALSHTWHVAAWWLCCAQRQRAQKPVGVGGGAPNSPQCSEPHGPRAPRHRPQDPSKAAVLIHTARGPRKGLWLLSRKPVVEGS